MLVYGDATRRLCPADAVDALWRDIRAIEGQPPGLDRHAALVAALIDAGALLQGVADAAFEARGGVDARSPAEDALTGLLLRLAEAVRASWESDFRTLAMPASGALAAVLGAALPGEIAVKRPEGYAFYALYPEAYAAAAAALDRSGPWRVIGIRSIGTSLSAVVAAALGAPPPVTLRPVGDPFRRILAIAPALAAEILAEPTARYAIVDEGPGLSGSSFGAVADFLEEGGVPRGTVHVFPSHGGDLGPKADPRHRERWATTPRHVVEFDQLLLGRSRPEHRLETWITRLAGPLTEPLIDLSGGAWRALRYASEADWPAANVQQERRKYLARTADGPWLAKFAGLGRDGPAKLERARALAQAGLCPEPAGLCHGFLVERWIDASRPLDSGGNPADLVEAVGRYLAFRARSFPADAAAGAPLAALAAMARHNIGQALGPDVARRVAPAADGLGRFESQVRRIETDNRMHAQEWLHLPGGQIIKTDALDHHAAHDLVGCQDVAWDVVGAALELGLSAADRERLCAIVERESGRPVSEDLLAFLTPCYLAFQLGAATLAAEALLGWPAEAARLRAEAARYGGLLRCL